MCLLHSVSFSVRGFDGFICSDAGAVALIKGANNTVKAAIALKNGVDQDLDGGEYDGLTQALQLGWIAESDLDVSLTRVFRERVRTGQLDPPELVPYSKYDLSVVDLPASRAIARQAAREGTVLLKNEGGLLPIDLTSADLKNIVVVGPNADRLYTLLGVRNIRSSPHLIVFLSLSVLIFVGCVCLCVYRTTMVARMLTGRTRPSTPAVFSSHHSPPSKKPSTQPTPLAHTPHRASPSRSSTAWTSTARTARASARL